MRLRITGGIITRFISCLAPFTYISGNAPGSCATDVREDNTHTSISRPGRIAGCSNPRFGPTLAGLIAAHDAHDFGRKAPEVFYLQLGFLGLLVPRNSDLGQSD